MPDTKWGSNQHEHRDVTDVPDRKAENGDGAGRRRPPIGEATFLAEVEEFVDAGEAAWVKPFPQLGNWVKA